MRASIRTGQTVSPRSRSAASAQRRLRSQRPAGSLRPSSLSSDRRYRNRCPPGRTNSSPREAHRSPTLCVMRGHSVVLTSALEEGFELERRVPSCCCSIRTRDACPAAAAACTDLRASFAKVCTLRWTAGGRTPHWRGRRSQKPAQRYEQLDRLTQQEVLDSIQGHDQDVQRAGLRGKNVEAGGSTNLHSPTRRMALGLLEELGCTAQFPVDFHQKVAHSGPGGIGGSQSERNSAAVLGRGR